MSSSNLTIRDSARSLGVHENTIRNWISKGFILAVRLPSGIRRVPKAEVERVRLSMIPVPVSPGDVGAPTVAKVAAEPLETPDQLPSSF